jgi:ribulose-phosphate 3-epimerase
MTNDGKGLGPAPWLSVGANAADPLHLGRDLDQLAEAGVSLFHIDVMDGVFCPQMTVGPAFVRAVSAGRVTDVHLMIDEPLEKVEAYVDAGADIITVHVEATRHPHRVLQRLGETGVTRGLALNPGTPLSAAEPLLDDLDQLLILAVNPGWPGQRFIAGTAARLAAAREMIDQRSIALGVDGGVTRANIAEIASLDVDFIVAGSAVFADGDPGAGALLMLDAVRATNPTSRASATRA